MKIIKICSKNILFYDFKDRMDIEYCWPCWQIHPDSRSIGHFLSGEDLLSADC